MKGKLSKAGNRGRGTDIGKPNPLAALYRMPFLGCWSNTIHQWYGMSKPEAVKFL